VLKKRLTKPADGVAIDAAATLAMINPVVPMVLFVSVAASVRPTKVWSEFGNVIMQFPVKPVSVNLRRALVPMNAVPAELTKNRLAITPLDFT
jgi:hypothetical protein